MQEFFSKLIWSLTLPVPISEKKEKITLKGLHKTFWGTTKKCENTNLS